MSVQNKVVIVTGSASGIGLATARLLAGEGAKVVIADRDASVARKVREDVAAVGGTAIDVAFDVGDSAQTRSFVHAVAQGWRTAVQHSEPPARFIDRLHVRRIHRCP